MYRFNLHHLKFLNTINVIKKCKSKFLHELPLAFSMKNAKNYFVNYYHFVNNQVHMGSFLESIGNEIPTFAGIKFTSANLEEGSQAVRADSGRYVIYLGNDQVRAPIQRENIIL